METNSSTNSSNPNSLFAPIQVSTLEHLGITLAWVVFCHTGPWPREHPMRIFVALQGYAKLILRPIVLHKWGLASSLFACYLMGRTRINWRRGVVVCLWLITDTTALILELVLGGTQATRTAPFKILTAILEGLFAVSILIYLARQALSIKGRGRRIWMQKWIILALWATVWGILVVLYWLHETSDLAIVVWLMTYAAIFHDSAHVYDRGEPAPDHDISAPVINSPWLAKQAGTRA